MPAPRPEILEYLEEAFAPLGRIDSARLFGGWRLLADGRPFAFVTGGTLYFRTDDAALRAELEAAGSRPFSYRKQGKTVTIGRFMSAPEGDMDDGEALLGWARRVLG